MNIEILEIENSYQKKKGDLPFYCEKYNVGIILSSDNFDKIVKDNNIAKELTNSLNNYSKDELKWWGLINYDYSKHLICFNINNLVHIGIQGCIEDKCKKLRKIPYLKVTITENEKCDNCTLYVGTGIDRTFGLFHPCETYDGITLGRLVVIFNNRCRLGWEEIDNTIHYPEFGICDLFIKSQD